MMDITCIVVCRMLLKMCNNYQPLVNKVNDINAWAVNHVMFA